MLLCFITLFPPLSEKNIFMSIMMIKQPYFFSEMNVLSRKSPLPKHCVKSVQIRSYFWSVFSCIFRKYGRKLTPYLDNFHTVQKNPMPIISQDCFVVSKTWKSWVSLSSIFAFEIVFIRLSKKLGTSVYITLRKICEVCCLTSETKMCKSLFFD